MPTATANASAVTAPATAALVARQPILDRDKILYGYELLYRARREDTHAEIRSRDAASVSVMLRACVDIGLSRLVGASPAFVNVTRGLILDPSLLPQNGERLILEILEDEIIDDTLIGALRQLRARGYRIALDDFVHSPHAPLQPSLLELAHYVKLDVLAHTPGELAAAVQKLRAWPAKLIAEKVETHEQFEQCHALGFDGFQGYYLFRPEITTEPVLGENRLSVLRLLSAVQNADTSADELESIIRHDAVLSYKLLRVVNSAYFALRTQVQSIRHAIVYLGMARVRSWVQMLALANLEDRPSELLKAALVRGRVCELLASDMAPEQREYAFTVGLFSLLDALLNVPMTQLLENLPVAEPVRVALLRGEGPWARMLSEHGHYETGAWQELHPLRLSVVGAAYLEAVEWAEQVFVGLNAPGPA